MLGYVKTRSDYAVGRVLKGKENFIASHQKIWKINFFSSLYSHIQLKINGGFIIRF
jgi:hypothetical protein